MQEADHLTRCARWVVLCWAVAACTMTQAASVSLVYGIPYNLVTNGLPEGQFTYSFDFTLPANTVGRVSGELRSLDVRNSSPGALPHAGLRLSSVRLYDGLGGTGPELADVSLIVVEHREDQGCPFGVPPPCGQVTVNRGTSAPFTDVDVPDQDFSLTFEAVGYSSAFVTGNLTASFRIFVIDAPGLPVGVPLPPGAVLLAVPLVMLGSRLVRRSQPTPSPPWIGCRRSLPQALPSREADGFMRI